MIYVIDDSRSAERITAEELLSMGSGTTARDDDGDLVIVVTVSGPVEENRIVHLTVGGEGGISLTYPPEGFEPYELVDIHLEVSA